VLTYIKNNKKIAGKEKKKKKKLQTCHGIKQFKLN
jgi:hypothetical protein